MYYVKISMSSKICLLDDDQNRLFCTVIQTIWMVKKTNTINEIFFSLGKSNRISEVERDLRWYLVQHPLPSRRNYGIRPACSGLCPIATWKPLRTETSQVLWKTCSTALLSSQGKSFSSVFSCWNISFQLMPIAFSVPTTYQSPW